MAFYNPDIKEKYFEERFPVTDKTTKVMLEKIQIRRNYVEECEPWERKYGLDLGDMNEEQLLDIMNHVGDLSYMRSIDRLQRLHGYINWYSKRENHYPTTIDWHDIDLSQTFRETMIGNPGQIITDWEKKYPCEDGWYIIPMYLLLWYGMEMQEIVDLAKEDVEILFDVVKIHRKNVRRGSNVLEIPGREAAMCFQKYASFTEADGTHKLWIRADTPYFFSRRIHPEDPPEKARLDRVKAYGQLRAGRLSPKMNKNVLVLYESNRFSAAGFYWRSIQAEKEKGSDLTDDEILDLYGSNRNYPYLLEAMRLSIEKYKQAFNL